MTRPMETIYSLLASVIDFFLNPFRSLQPFWPLSLLSVITGIFLLVIFRFTSNQKGIQDTKNKIKAHLLEVRIFKDDLKILLSAQGSILKYNAKYFLYGLKPLVFMIIPVGVLLIQLEGWFGQRPLLPGEQTMVTVQMNHEGAGLLSQVEIEGDFGVIVETPSLRIPSSLEVNWRLRARSPGNHQMLIKLPGQIVPKSVTVASDGLARVSPVKPSSGFWDVFLHPGEQPIAENSPIRQIILTYPPRSIDILGWKLHWLLVFLVLSTLAGFLFKGVFGVEI